MFTKQDKDRLFSAHTHDTNYNNIDIYSNIFTFYDDRHIYYYTEFPHL